MNLSVSQLQKQNAALLKLAKSSAIDSGDLKQALREITEVGAATLDIKRCSVWSYTPEKDAIICLDLYEADKNQHSEGILLKAKDFPAYFQYLTEERFLAADDAVTHPNTYEFAEVYLKPLGISSMLDAPFRRSGEMHGVICNEHVGPMRHWTDEEQNFAGSLADLISRAFEAQARREAQEELRRANERLEQKVEERTRQLRETLEQVKALKEQQDADYFLTTLLLQPLSKISNHSNDFCQLQSFVKQKKTFRFKERDYQIGGDYVFADSVLIGEKPHIFAINADAMGKSIQGAGGALILGSVLRALLQQKPRAHITPAGWLTALYRRLHRVFLSFNGSMTVSLSMALISSDGLAYILSAEHPAPVVYHDGVARLLPVKQIAKLGSTRDDLNLSKIPILKIKLRKGDALILASDGRDDILIQEQDGKSYNQDESAFPRLVEKAGPAPDAVATNLANIGEITDDLSILALKMV